MRCILTISLCICILMLANCVNDVDVANTPTASILSAEFTGSTEDKHNPSTGIISTELEIRSFEKGETALSIYCQVTVTWSMCNSNTFVSYSLYRSTNPEISDNLGNAELLYTIDDSEVTVYVDDDVEWNTHYYYALKTTGLADEYAWSNEADVNTPTGNPPTSSVLTHSSDANAVNLWWTKCSDSNFTMYTLYRSANQSIETDTLAAEKLTSFTDPNELSYEDTTLNTQSAYYALRTSNTMGHHAWSNEIQAVLRDSAIVAWGRNNDGQCDIPTPNAGYIEVAGGWMHSLGIQSDGSVIAWGENGDSQCDVPSPNTDFEIVAGGWKHSLGLKSDGSIVAWGNNASGQCDVPSPNSSFTDVSGGYIHSLGLKSNGSIVAWGGNNWGQSSVPSPNSDFVAVTAGNEHSLGLKSDGSIVGWGGNYFGQCNPPSPNSDFIAVAAGMNHSLGLKSDGSIVAWGWNADGQCDVPSPNSDFIAIAAGWGFSMGLKSDGSIVAWGSDEYSQCTIPQTNSDFTAVSAGMNHSLALKIRFL